MINQEQTMYYINNNIYVTNLRNVVTVINNLGSNNFSKRPLYYITDNEALILTDELERELNYYNLEIQLVPMNTDVLSLPKSIIIFDDNRANDYVYSYYKKIFSLLTLSDITFSSFIGDIGIKTPILGNEMTINITSIDSKNTPLNLLIYLKGIAADTVETNKLLQDKLLVNLGKIKIEQITKFFVLSDFYLGILAKNCLSFKDFMGRVDLGAITVESFDELYTILKAEQLNFPTYLSEIQIYDLGVIFAVNDLCNKIQTNTDFMPILQTLIHESESAYFSKRSMRLNGIKI